MTPADILKYIVYPLWMERRKYTWNQFWCSVNMTMVLSVEGTVNDNVKFNGKWKNSFWLMVLHC